MIELIFTSDYELFGNGQGEVESCMIGPSNLLMDILDDFDYKMTFFVDVCEIWAFEQVKETGGFSSGRDPGQEVRKNIIEMIERGHDVQLHLHPQWLDFQYKNGEWFLNYDYWRLPKVSEHPIWDIDTLIKKGKDYLEELIRPIRKDYNCQAFRAGAYCIQPEEKVIAALKKNNFKYDTSVLTNKKIDNKLSYYNFGHHPKEYFYGIGQTLEEVETGSQLVEVPIFTTPISRIKFLSFLKNRTAMKACGCVGEPTLKSLNIDNSTKFQKAKKLLHAQHLIFDYCGSSFAELKYIAEKAIGRFDHDKKQIPIVLIGHPKNFANETNLRQFLSWCSTNELITSNTNRLFFSQ